MKKDIKKDIKEIIQLCLISGVAIAIVFHMNSILSSRDKNSVKKTQEMVTPVDSVDMVTKGVKQRIR